MSNMRMEECVNVINECSKIDMSRLDWIEQLTLMYAMAEFAEKIKPVLLKYKAKEVNSETFLMRI